ncbi:MAG TPA: hypothetical protein VHC90_20295 [Bryobacteraceae bacterium]|nr:hypothetical protein [Bryobacteraceae bacterium]
MQIDLASIQTLATYAVTTFVTAGIGAYLASYFKKKGENLATHEDIGKLVDQMKAVTHADSGRRRTRFRDEAERHSGMIPNAIPG